MISAAALQARVRAELAERLTLLQARPARSRSISAPARAAGAQALARAYRARRSSWRSTPPQACCARRAARSGLFRRFARVLRPMRRALPLATGSVDLVFSSLMLQWCDDLAQPLAEARRVLTTRRALHLQHASGPTH